MNISKQPKYLLETDILIDYLTFEKSGSQPFLLSLMQKGICFTSVLNASELFMLANSNYEVTKVRDLLNSIKVIGLHSRYSLSIPNYINKFSNIRDALFYILAEQNRLMILSLKPEKYTGLNVQSIHPQLIKE